MKTREELITDILAFRDNEDKKAVIAAAPLTRNTASRGFRLFDITFSYSGDGYSAYALTDGDRVGGAHVDSLGDWEPPRQHMVPGAETPYRGQGIGTMLYFAGSFSTAALDYAENEGTDPKVVSTNKCEDYGGGRSGDAERWWDKATGEKGFADRGVCSYYESARLDVELPAEDIIDTYEVDAAVEEVEDRFEEEVISPAFDVYLADFDEYSDPTLRVQAMLDSMEDDAKDLLEDAASNHGLSAESFEWEAGELVDDGGISLEMDVQFVGYVDDSDVQYYFDSQIETALEDEGIQWSDYDVQYADVLENPSISYKIFVSFTLEDDQRKLGAIKVEKREGPSNEGEARVDVSYDGEGDLDVLEGVYQMQEAGLIFALSNTMKGEFEENDVELPAITVPERYGQLDFEEQDPFIVGMVAGLNGISYARKVVEVVENKVSKNLSTDALRKFLESMIQGAELTSQEAYESRQLELFPRAENPPSPRRIERELSRRDLDLMDLADID